MLNWVDYVILGLLILFAFEGFRKSFVGEVFDLFAFAVAFFTSLRFYNLTSSFFEREFQVAHSLANVLGFIAVWFLVELVLFLVIRILLERLKLHSQILKKFDMFSMIPSFLRGLVFIAILLVLIGTFPIQPKIKLAVQESKIGSEILDKAYKLEGPLKQVFGGITQDTLTFLTIKPKSDESVNLGFQTTDFKPDQSLEEQMINLVNKERSERGLKTLKFDSALREVGRAHSGDMFIRGYFSHYSPEGDSVADRADRRKIDYKVIGENLAYAPTLDLAHTGLMNSPGHRANILSEDFNKVGIGILDGEVYGLMVTQVFSN